MNSLISHPPSGEYAALLGCGEFQSLARGWRNPLALSQIHQQVRDINPRDVLSNWVVAAPMENLHETVNPTICTNVNASLGGLIQGK